PGIPRVAWLPFTGACLQVIVFRNHLSGTPSGEAPSCVPHGPPIPPWFSSTSTLQAGFGTTVSMDPGFSPPTGSAPFRTAQGCSQRVLDAPPTRRDGTDRWDPRSLGFERRFECWGNGDGMGGSDG